LAQVVPARRDARQLDRRLSAAEPPRDACCELADTVRVAAGGPGARVDGLREARGRAVAGGAIRALGELLELLDLDESRLVAACPVLAVLLRPVHRAVGQANQLVTAGALNRIRRDARAHRHRPDLLEVG